MIFTKTFEMFYSPINYNIKYFRSKFKTSKISILYSKQIYFTSIKEENVENEKAFVLLLISDSKSISRNTI